MDGDVAGFPAPPKRMNPTAQLEYDEFVTREMAQWHVPGCAIAIVRDGAVVHANGYGVRDVQTGLPVSASTLFPIGSLTKSFTAAMIAVLVRRGKLDWDRPVREYLPDFQLWDENATRRITLRDLLTHQTGLPPHDMAWERSPLSREEFYHRLRYLQPSQDLRQGYQYNNVMFMVAGYLAGRIMGRTWEELVKQIVLDPVGMPRTSFVARDIPATENLAKPHRADSDGVPHDFAFRSDEAIAPAGALVAPLDEMARYVQMLLNRGRIDGREVLAPQDVAALRTPQVVVPAGAKYSELGPSQYGLGVLVSSYRGHTHIYHGGKCEGFSALISLLPDIHAGVVVLSNLDATRMPFVLAYRALDQLLNLHPIAWGDRFREFQKALDRSNSAGAAGLSHPRWENTRPSHPIDAYAGEFAHPAYGSLTIRVLDPNRADSPLALDFHEFSTCLDHFHFDIFEAPADPLNRLERTRVKFETDWNGEISRLQIPFEPLVADIVFERVPDPRMSSAEFLSPLVGRYGTGTRALRVEFDEDGSLRLIARHRVARRLIPVRGLLFRVEGSGGYAVEFRKDADGAATCVAFYRPGGGYAAERVVG